MSIYRGVEGSGTLPPRIATALVVTAHPDDAEFTFGGTIARLAAGGTQVSYVVCTDGEQGGGDHGGDASAVAATRRAEQRRAAAVLGVSHVSFLGFPDGSLTATLVIRRAIAREIRLSRPQLVLTHWPLRSLTFPIGASHPDHFAVGEACLAAVYPDACNPCAHPELLTEGLVPHVVDEVWLPGYAQPNHFVDVSATASLKIDAILEHRSQFSPDRTIAESSVRWVWDRLRGNGPVAGCAFAEAFVRIVTGSYAGVGPPPARVEQEASVW